MTQRNTRLVIDFSRYIIDQTRDFTGREWVFKAVNDWLANPGRPRFFLLTGEPGSGKTAIASRLSQFTQGTVLPPDGLTQLTPDFLSAMHFCSARDSRWFNPHVFAESLAMQLARRYPAYAKALAEKSGDRQIRIEVNQQVEHVVDGQVVGIIIKSLNVGEVAPEDAFNRVVREPLEALFRDGFTQQVIILIDALDEALRYSGSINIVSLLTQAANLPTDVRFLVTTRPDTYILRPLRRFPPLKEHTLTSGEELTHSLDDIQRYVLEAIDTQPELATKLVLSLSPKAFAHAVQQKSDGNFLYVRYLLKMLVDQREQISHETLNTLPTGLDGIYLEFLDRLVGEDKKCWAEKYRPVVGTLAVAQEALTGKQLADFIGMTESEVRSTLTSLLQFLDTDDALPASQRTYAIYHRSFADFLLDEDRAEEYWCKEADQHLRIAVYYLKSYLKANQVGDWDMCDAYGLQYTATHLAEAARGSEPSQRHEHTAQLVRLILDPAFQQARVVDLIGFQQDLKLALRTVAVDNEPLALPLVVKVALALVAFHRQRLQPEQVFDLARTGNLKAAEERLRLLGLDFAIDLEWQQAVLLTLAWLAAKKNPLDARVLYDLVAKEPSNIDNLSLFMKRVEAALNGTDVSPATLPPLPPAPLPDNVHDDVRAILARVGGRDDEGVLWNSRIGPIYHTDEVVLMEKPLLKEFYNYGTATFLWSDDRPPVYLAEQDSPLLVAYAVTNPDEGTEYVKQYLTILAADTYGFYRNRSLWGMLGAVLRHPNSNWVLEILPALEAAVLADRSQEFQEGLPLTILALQAAAGQTNAKFTLKSRAQEIRAEAGQLSGQREQGDSWGSHKRRLVALAQVYSLLQSQDAIAVDLLTRALHLPFGYAGFQASACLSLAEAIRACQVGDRVSIEDALLAAQKAAHNIQDPVFCARTTARFNALRDRWWRSPALGFDVVSAVEHFVHTPDAPDFAALHVIGERYGTRVQGPNKLPLPNWMLQADTLEVLAQVYRRPLVEFQWLNCEQNRAPTERLPVRMQVNVPDPNFAPLLAARFAAEVLATKSLSAAKRVGLIQSLVPIAAVNPTALDSVLAWLLLAARPDDSSVLEDLAQTVTRYLNSLPETIRRGIEPRK